MLVLPDGRTGPLHRKVRLLALRWLLNQDTPLKNTLMAQPKQALAAMDETVLPLVLCAMSGARADLIDRIVPELMLRVSTRETVTWERPVELLHRGNERISVDARAMLLSPSGAEVMLEGPTPVDQLAGVPMRHGLLALQDDFPLRLEEAHPEKHGNALDLGGRSIEEWEDSLDAALAYIESGLPGWREEGPLHTVVPVGFEPHRSLSASYREAPGVAWVSLHPDPVVMAEALVHENQHSRLNLLSWLDPVLENAWTEWSPSPVRPDLRPLMGVLLAVHAFVPVAVMHRAHNQPERAQRAWDSNERGLKVLRDKARPTAVGARLLRTLEEQHRAAAG